MEHLFNTLWGPVLVAIFRIFDVTFGTFRTILVVQGRKIPAAFVGAAEVLIWVTAIQYILKFIDTNPWNLAGYAIGFGLGNILGITLEQKIGLGFAQLNIISVHKADELTESLRESGFGVTALEAAGKDGKRSVIMCIVERKYQKNVMKIIDKIDPDAFISIQSSLPYRGFRHGSRK